MATLLRKILGDSLASSFATGPTADTDVYLPSPESLKRKILLKCTLGKNTSPQLWDMVHLMGRKYGYSTLTYGSPALPHLPSFLLLFSQHLYFLTSTLLILIFQFYASQPLHLVLQLSILLSRLLLCERYAIPLSQSAVSLSVWTKTRGGHGR